MMSDVFKCKTHSHYYPPLTIALTCSTVIIHAACSTKQVAQLWQRDRAKLETFSINVQRYSQNHAQNCISGPPYELIGRNVSGLFERFNAKKLCSRVSCHFY